MIFIHDMNPSLLPRPVSSRLARNLCVMPAVVLTGARQTGKSTLTRELAPGPRRFETLDDFAVARTARRDPRALLAGPGPVTLAQAQREPHLLPALKIEIDERRARGDRRGGQFLLTGSANLLLMRRVTESLAGRAGYLNLWPMTRREQRGDESGAAREELVRADDRDWPALLAARPAEREDWRHLARRGGLPTPPVHLTDAEERAVSFDGYVRAYLERGLSDLAAVSSLPDFRLLMKLAAERLGQAVNQTNLGRDCSLPQPTVRRYLDLLEVSYQLVRLPAYAVNRGKRLVRTPKLYWGDTGVALHLASGMAPGGAHLENVVLNDLLVWRDTRSAKAEVSYWRTTIGEEVDFVIENERRLLPVEVKAAARPRLRDARGLLAFQEAYGDAARAGLLLHTGSEVEWLTGRVLAAPWWKVL